MLQSCGNIALKKKENIFGGDTDGKCLDGKSAQKTLQLNGFDIRCPASLGLAKQFYVYKFYG